ncbi:MAG: DUF4105 domain-containing protein [Proteobacteria bacterium]|nr:DUF4105 domain-containing protein [Pseudomonadota bacterium]
MFSRRRLIVVLFFCRSFHSFSYDLKAAAQDLRWLSLYQYKIKGRYIRSDIKNELFFFSPLGYKNPEAELQAALKAYNHPEQKNFGLQKLSAGCAFPARKKRLEEILSITFPHVDCPDFDEWEKTVSAQKVSLIFAGAYMNNPASILGHTFLRLGRIQESREGADLLSYSVGFLAQAESQDSGLMYAIKGLSGSYPGYYDIKAHYMNVALYNNSESRDLWEYNLNLSSEETNFLVKYLWELLFNAQFRYYFVDENCSYRLLTLLEAVRPQSQLSQKILGIVLPVNTLRVLKKENFIDPKEPKFRTSIKRKISHSLDHLTPMERDQYDSLIQQQISPNEIQNPQISDIALDQMKFQSYQYKGNPPQKYLNFERELLESRSRMISKSLSPLEIPEPAPPLQGHPTSYLMIKGASLNQQALMQFESFMGAHDIKQIEASFEDVGSMNFLGAKVPYNLQSKKFVGTEFTLADVYSLPNFDRNFKNIAWNFNFQIRQLCELCFNDLWNFKGEAGAGLSHDFKMGLRIFSMPSFRAYAAYKNGPQGSVLMGLNSGIKVNRKNFNLFFQNKIFAKSKYFLASFSFENRIYLKQDKSLIFGIERTQASHNKTQTLYFSGLEIFF